MDDAYSKDNICIECIVNPRDAGNKKIWKQGKKMALLLSVNAHWDKKRMVIELILSVCRCSGHVPATDSRRRGEADQTWERRS